MNRFARALSAFVPSLVLLAVAASPAAAQPPPDPGPQPDPNQPVREVCVPAGLALAVIADSGTVAEVLPPQRNSLDPALSPTAKITVQAPAAVGACADFEGFWGEATGGREHAQLLLFSLANANDPALATQIARDAVTETRRGPSRHEEKLEAIGKFDKPGVYQLAAQLVVEAGEPHAAGAVGSMVSDQHRFVFTLEVLGGEPVPEPAANGAITGRVTDLSGAPIEGAVVSAMPRSNVRPIPAERWSVAPNAVRSVPMNGAAGAPIAPVSLSNTTQQAGPSARTGPDGRYAMRLREGRYFVRAEARGYVGEWFDDAAAATNAQPVPVRDGEETPAVDFELRTATPSTQPNPNDFATITGTVSWPDGRPVASVRVMAVLAAHAIPSNPNVPPERNLRGISTVTDRDGQFELQVRPETYVLAAFEPPTASGRSDVAQYYDHADRIQDAEQLVLAPGDELEGIDFTLVMP